MPAAIGRPKHYPEGGNFGMAAKSQEPSRLNDIPQLLRGAGACLYIRAFIFSFRRFLRGFARL